jgi:hypothetical protein
MLHEADGVATVCSPAIDGEEALSVYDKWAAEDGRPVFNLGPVIPLRPGTSQFALPTLQAELASVPPGIANKVTGFLSKTLESKGAGSVVYVAFGNFFW